MSYLIIPVKDLESAKDDKGKITEMVALELLNLLNKEGNMVRRMIAEATDAIIKTFNSVDNPRPAWASHVQVEVILPKPAQVGMAVWHQEHKV